LSVIAKIEVKRGDLRPFHRHVANPFLKAAPEEADGDYRPGYIELISILLFLCEQTLQSAAEMSSDVINAN
jgi:hypothetical protein